MKSFKQADARHVVERVTASVASGHERDALLLLASECLREASHWLDHDNTGARVVHETKVDADRSMRDSATVVPQRVKARA